MSEELQKAEVRLAERVAQVNSPEMVKFREAVLQTIEIFTVKIMAAPTKDETWDAVIGLRAVIGTLVSLENAEQDLAAIRSQLAHAMVSQERVAAKVAARHSSRFSNAGCAG